MAAISGEVPLAELNDYQSRLKSLTGGQGSYTIVSVSNAAGRMRLAFPASTARYYQLVYSTNLFSGTIVSNLGWGAPGMAITNNAPGTWYGRIRSRLAAPP